ncbi:DUF6782 family putative metallopeptidase [Corallococcus terminator]
MSSFGPPKQDYSKLGSQPVAASKPRAVEAPKKPLENPQKLQALKDVLNKSPLGALAVKFLEDRKVKVEFDEVPSQWNGKTINIDGRLSLGAAALDLVHEARHARETLDKTTPSSKEPKDSFIAGNIREEAMATVDGIRVKDDLMAQGINVSASFPMETQYREAYNDALAKGHGSAIAEQQAFDRVHAGFLNGEVPNGITNRPYSEFYSEEWDKQQK